MGCTHVFPVEGLLVWSFLVTNREPDTVRQWVSFAAGDVVISAGTRDSLTCPASQPPITP